MMFWAVNMVTAVFTLPLIECPFVARTPLGYESPDSLNLYFRLTFDNFMVTFLRYFQHSGFKIILSVF